MAPGRAGSTPVRRVEQAIDVGGEMSVARDGWIDIVSATGVVWRHESYVSCAPRG